MPVETIAIFEVGKTIKKFLLFNEDLKLRHKEEEELSEITDDEDIARDDKAGIETWMQRCLTEVLEAGVYTIRAVNFVTNDVSLMYPYVQEFCRNNGIETGNGMHDLAASLVPYLKASRHKFILISTGTWCIFMNPFNQEPLTTEQLRNNSFCFVSIRQQQVKSSRLYLGHIHDVNVEKLNAYFGAVAGHHKTIKANPDKINRIMQNYKGRTFFRQGVPEDYIDTSADLSAFLTFGDAYNRLLADLVDLCMESLRLVTASDDQTRVVYISGSFSRSEIFAKMLAARLPDKEVYISEVDDAVALGAALVIREHVFSEPLPFIGLGLKSVIFNG